MNTVDKILKRLKEPREKTTLDRYFDEYFAMEKERKLVQKHMLENSKNEENPVVLIKK